MRGESAVPALRRALAANPSPESRRRLQALMDGPGEAPSGEELRALRAVWALELVGTPDAVEVLVRLAGGVAESRVTQDAAAALARLRAVAQRRP
jgi:hypothetical protein